jgi:RND family efflux transporter MFP subunit
MDWLSYSGVTAPAEQSAVAFRVAGQVISVEAEVGDEVNAGDVLARLDPADFHLAVESLNGQIDQEEAQLDAMRAGAREEEMQRLRSDLEAAEARLRALQTNYERYQELLASGTVSQREFDEVEARYLTARSERDSSEQAVLEGERGARPEDVRAQEAHIASLRAQLETARNNLHYTELRAPFSGRIVTRDVEPGEQVQTQQSVFRLHSTDVLEMRVGVPEEVFRLRSVEHDLVVLVRLNQIPDHEFETTERLFSRDIDSSTQTYPVTVRFNNADDLALPGMSGEVRVGVPSTTGALTVPLTAIFEQPGGQRVLWVVENGRVHERSVQIGDVTGAQVPILSGISEGDLVVTAGVGALSEGMEVKVLESSPLRAHSE